MAATQNIHVPKFGNWDGEEVAYTKFFDKARKGKDDVPKRFNPNDPEENPDAFPSMIFAAGHVQEKQQFDDQSFDSYVVNRPRAPQSREDDQSFDSYVVNRPQAQPQSREDNRSQREMGAPSRSPYSHKNSRSDDQSQREMDTPRRGREMGTPSRGSPYSHKSGRDGNQSQSEMGTPSRGSPYSHKSGRDGNQSQSEMGTPSRGSPYSHKSGRSDDHSPREMGNPSRGSPYSYKSSRNNDQSQREMGTPTHNHKENLYTNRNGNRDNKYGNLVLDSQYLNEPNKHTEEGSYIVSPATPTVVIKQGRFRQGQTPRNKTVVPKFGIWDSVDASGESFSIIFSKVKEEKHHAATTLPTIPDDSLKSRDRERNYKKPSRLSKISCCFRPAASE